jgi:hypothetical protein
MTAVEVTVETTFSRRLFLTLTSVALGAHRTLWAADPVPSALDHIILGIHDLDRGIAWMDERTGVRAVFGGVHPGRGTRNALLSLGPRRYLEILAPDPQQSSQSWYKELGTLREPRLIGWAVHTESVAAVAKKALAAGIAIDEPTDGSRARPDGKTLRWKTFRLKDDRGGLLPFFIEWGQESAHPSADAPAGCTLARFLLQSPAPRELTKVCQRLGVDVAVERGGKSLLRARISSSKGHVELMS